MTPWAPRGRLLSILASLGIAFLGVALGAAACGAGAQDDLAVCAKRQPAAVRSFLQCGPTLDFTPIHQYRGEIAGVEEREDAVVLIEGDCSGTLIAASAGPVV